MKKVSFIALALGAIMFTACQEDGSVVNETVELSVATAAYDATSEAVLSTSMEEVDLTTDETIEKYFAQEGRKRFDRLECATVTEDSTTNMITIDFGDGCEDRRGVLRSGKIIVEYSGRRHTPGSYRIVTFEDFYLDSVKIEGKRTLTNTTDTTVADVYVYETKLEGGVLTFADGTTITRDAAHTRTKYKGESWNEGYTTLTGSASGLLQDGTEYTSTILEEIVFTRECEVHAPVSGVKEFVAGETTITIDFGDGTCDNLADVTTNGTTESIEIESARSFGDGHHKDGRGGKKGRK